MTADAPDLTGSDRRTIIQSSMPVSRSAIDFLADVPEYLAATQIMFDEVRDLEDQFDRQQRTREVYRRVQGFATSAGQAGLSVAAQFGSVLATLLKKLCDNPNTLTPSTSNTVSKAL